MKDYMLRPLNHMESRLHREHLDRLNKMIKDLNVDTNLPPPPELERLARATARLFDYVGFVPTPLGVMIRDEPDILDEQIPEMQAVVANDWMQAHKAMKHGPTAA